MVFTRRQKQALVAANPLRDASILKQVFSFLPGHWLFLGAVCREWAAAYASIAEQQVRSVSLYGNPKLVTCGAKTTLYSAAVASPATAELAFAYGLAISGNELQVIAGLHADVETLTVLQELGIPLNDRVGKAVALSGRMNVLQHLLTTMQWLRTSSALSHYAARSGSISMLKWLRTESWCEFNYYTCAGAAQGGQLAALQHLRSEGCDWDIENITRDAASSGSIQVVEWLRQQQGIKVRAIALTAAAYAGHIAMCEYLRSIGCRLDADACRLAASNGDLSTLRWLRENGCPWRLSDICRTAARHGFTGILDYVIEQDEVYDG
jgi:hypothetical protein